MRRLSRNGVWRSVTECNNRRTQHSRKIFIGILKQLKQAPDMKAGNVRFKVTCYGQKLGDIAAFLVFPGSTVRQHQAYPRYIRMGAECSKTQDFPVPYLVASCRWRTPCIPSAQA